ncbi:hypothetical protein O3P69_004681 [Scylla paramamosain]|uniref:Uncharacterized protein n=1 Tax=Scylla paramamosain TaxID=85552 RepID=A0AAW0UDY2_SCYPA
MVAQTAEPRLFIQACTGDMKMNLMSFMKLDSEDWTPRKLTPLEVRKGAECAPFAVRYHFEKIVNGPIGFSCLEAITAYTDARMVTAHECSAMSLVQKLWEGENTWHSEGEDSAMSLEDRRVLQMWTYNIRTVAGHYDLTIPFQDEEPGMPNNTEMVQKRLKRLKRHLARDPAQTTTCRRDRTTDVKGLCRVGASA